MENLLNSVKLNISLKWVIQCFVWHAAAAVQCIYNFMLCNFQIEFILPHFQFHSERMIQCVDDEENERENHKGKSELRKIEENRVEMNIRKFDNRFQFP